MKKRVLRLSFGLVFVLNAIQASAAGIGWLEAQSRPDGSIHAGAGVATAWQDSAEALRTFALSGNAYDAGPALDYLDGVAAGHTQLLARRIIARAEAGRAVSGLADELRARQNGDGGFGSYPGYGSSALDTAFALEALALAGESSHPAAAAGVNFLQDRQQPGGAWQLGDAASVYVTALCLRAVWLYRKTADVESTVARARDDLLGRRDAQGLWGGTFESALALIAIVPTLVDRGGIQAGVDALAARQQADGSFGNDVYRTALALRALRLAELPAPDAMRITGFVKDGDTGAGLAGAAVALSGPEAKQATAGTAGAYAFTVAKAGTYTVSMEVPNYETGEVTTSVEPGVTRELGATHLFKLSTDPDTGAAIDTATLFGRITDKRNGRPVAGALVRAGGVQAVSGGDGTYQVTNSPTGDVLVEVSADGFEPASGAFTLEAGSRAIYSPSLAAAQTQGVAVTGRILDAETGSAVEGVGVSLTQDGRTQTAATDIEGRYGLEAAAGPFEVALSRAGYRPVSAALSGTAGSRIDYSPELVPDGAPDPAREPAAVSGYVVSQASGKALPDAQLTLTYEDGEVVAAATGADGGFALSGLKAGGAVLNIDKDSNTGNGYASLDIPLSLSPDTRYDLQRIELQPRSGEFSRITGRVLDFGTGAPVESVVVSYRNAGAFGQAFTNENGEFELFRAPAEEMLLRFFKSGYEFIQFPFTLAESEQVDVGDIYLKQLDIDSFLPDLQVRELDTSGLASTDALDISGVLGVTVINAGNANVASPFAVTAFEDTDADGRYSPGADRVLGEFLVEEEIAVDGQATVGLPIDTEQSFRDAPIHVALDTALAVTELSEQNNGARTAGACPDQIKPRIDVVMCLDASGSINPDDFAIELEGTASAIENADVMPHDGTARVSVVNFGSSARVVVEPVAVYADNAVLIANTVREKGSNRSGGGTNIAACIDKAVDLLNAVRVESAFQIIDISTDGFADLDRTLAAVENAVDNGVDAINMIGIGADSDLDFMNAVVRPQPAGGDRGFAVQVGGFDEYISAVADKVQREAVLAKFTDLSLGRVVFTDNGPGRAASLGAVVGNAGTADIENDIQVDFYNGAASGQPLGAVTIPGGLPAGGFTPVSLDEVGTAGLDQAQILAVASIPAGATECDVSNNQASVTARSGRGTVSLQLGEHTVAPQTDLVISAQIDNPGALSNAYTLALSIRDPQGATVIDFNDRTVSELSGDASVRLEQLWNSGLTPAGTYTVVAELYGSGKLLDAAQVSLEIREGGAGGAAPARVRTSSDRTSYHVNDVVRLENLVRNVSSSTYLQNTELQIQVLTPSGGELFAAAYAVNALAPGGFQQLFAPVTLAGAEQGTYAVNAMLKDNTGALLAADQVEYTVTQDTAIALRGKADAERPLLSAGDTQICRYSVQNTGAAAIAGQRLWQSLVDITRGTPVGAVPLDRTLPAGGRNEFIQSFDTGGLAAGDYACVLEALIDDQRLPLAYGLFELDVPPVRLEAAFEPGPRGRLLVLLDGDDRHCDRKQDRHDGDRDRHRGHHADWRDKDGKHGDCRDRSGGHGDSHREQPGPGEQREYLEQLLDRSGWSYTVVTGKHDFSRELRSGGYTVYALLSEHVKLDNATLEELREAVFRGEGLLVAGGHDGRNSKINPALGATFTGRQKAAGLDVPESDFHAAGSAALQYGKVRRMRPETAQTLARFTGIHPEHGDGGYYGKDRGCGKNRHDRDRHDKDRGRHDKRHHHPHCEPVRDTAIAGNDYGEGRAVTAGFDLLREAATGEDSRAANLFESLLLAALGHAHPEALQPSAGDVLALRLVVENAGIATPGRGVVTLPADTGVLDAGEAALVDGHWLWPFDLAEGETAVLDMHVRPPYRDAAPASFGALIQTGTEPDFIDDQLLEFEFQPPPAPDIDTVLADLNAAAAGDHRLKMAAWRVRKAGRWLERDRIEAALRELLKATDWLAASDHAQADSLRVRVGGLIKTVARRAGGRGGWHGGPSGHIFETGKH